MDAFSSQARGTATPSVIPIRPSAQQSPTPGLPGLLGALSKARSRWNHPHLPRDLAHILVLHSVLQPLPAWACPCADPCPTGSIHTVPTGRLQPAQASVECLQHQMLFKFKSNMETSRYLQRHGPRTLEDPPGPPHPEQALQALYPSSLSGKIPFSPRGSPALRKQGHPSRS